MRTKAILLSAAVIAAGIATSAAQSVYSVNAVGYVNVTLVPGYNLLNNPLNGTNNNHINAVIPSVPDGTLALKWNAGAQQFAPPDNFFLELGGWVDDSFSPTATTIKPGEGFFLQNNSGGNLALTFVGEVPQGSLSNNININYGFYGSQVPQSASLPLLSFPSGPAMQGASYIPWNKATQQYGRPYTYLDGVWYNDDFIPEDPIPAVAEGFVVNNPNPAVGWTRNFSVNNN